MTVAYLYKRPIFILQKPDKKLFCYEEIMGLQPIFPKPIFLNKADFSKPRFNQNYPVVILKIPSHF